MFAGAMALFSLIITPRSRTSESFFQGKTASGEAPGLWTLVLSQVTTWIFARSLLNAAILGFFYGLWGTLAYAFYYFSFLTGGKIIDSLRFEHGFDSVQGFLQARFGRAGTMSYNFVIGLRLVSEVFANVLVIGILFGAEGSGAYVLTIALFSILTLLYSMAGGLQASLRTDVIQMTLFFGTLLFLILSVFGGGHFALGDLGWKGFDISNPGPILMIVALLQVWSYPMHDPVMMDRGFLADRKTTRKSFLHAAWISFLCITAFGALGVLAGANTLGDESMNDTLLRLLGPALMVLFNGALVISAMSTLDSTLSSSAKLVVKDMGFTKGRPADGRVVMVLFMLAGLLFVFWGNKDLFSAVAVSGTASLYLAPVIFFSLWGKQKHISVYSYLFTFFLAIAGSALYFLESSGHTTLLGDAHKYTKLLWISLGILTGGNLSFWLGIQRRGGQK